jgi:hypothetical protein
LGDEPGEQPVTAVEAGSDLAISDAGLPLPWINATGLPNSVITENNDTRQIAYQLSTWVSKARAASGRSVATDPGIYVPQENVYDEIRSARHAMEHDSIVSGVAEVTEAMAFAGLSWESPNPDDADALNQLAEDADLDGLMRRMWYDMFSCSQAVVAAHWGWVEYTVRGQTKNGNRRKKTYRFFAPQQLKTLDPAKVVPTGAGPVAGEGLAWQASGGEIDAYWDAFDGRINDPLMLSYFTGQYLPTVTEAAQLAADGVDTTRLLAMDPAAVFRHTLTKPDYQRHPAVRLRSCFSTLDLKQQLLASDRAMLVGAANYILLVRKGTDAAPAQQQEITHLRENFNFVAKLPVIFSDHRLEIEIIAPKTDFVLDRARYDTLDERLLTRLLGTLLIPGHGRDTTDTVATAVARTMENRRHMMRLCLQRRIARAIVDHPRNRGVFEQPPSLVFSPRNIALAADPTYAQGLLALRTQREISRETILEYFGLDEAVEAMRMQTEEEFFDDIFRTHVPFSAPAPTAGTAPADGTSPDTAAPSPDATGNNRAAPAPTPNGTPEAPGVSGARGGRPVGGGDRPQSPAAVRPRTRKGNPST